MEALSFLNDLDSITPTPILVAPHPVLSRKAARVQASDMPQIRAALPGMFAAMYHAPGIGLAAPQVGIGLRFMIIDIVENDARRPRIFINPEITSFSEEEAATEEGCLSVPNQYAEVVRPARITVKYQNLNGEDEELETDGLLAICIQHEIDHLDGILFVDHLSKLKRNMLMRKLAKEQRGK